MCLKKNSKSLAWRALQLLIFKSFNPVVETCGVSWAVVWMPAWGRKQIPAQACELPTLSLKSKSLRENYWWDGKVGTILRRDKGERGLECICWAEAPKNTVLMSTWWRDAVLWKNKRRVGRSVQKEKRLSDSGSESKIHLAWFEGTITGTRYQQEWWKGGGWKRQKAMSQRNWSESTQELQEKIMKTVLTLQSQWGCQRERVMIDPEINYQEEEIKVKGLSYSSGYSLLLNSLDGKKLQASLRM